jgi:hypothetical protein
MTKNEQASTPSAGDYWDRLGEELKPQCYSENARRYSLGLEEVQALIGGLCQMHRWPRSRLASMTGIPCGRLNFISSGRVEASEVEKRVLWIIWCIDTESKDITDEFRWMTWGKVRRDEEAWLLGKQRTKDDMILPECSWLAIDWRLSNSKLSKRHRHAPELLETVRAHYTKYTTKELRNYIANAGHNPNFAYGIHPNANPNRKLKPKLARHPAETPVDRAFSRLKEMLSARSVE